MNPKLYLQAELYLDGSLSDAERTAFEDAMKNDTKLADAVRKLRADNLMLRNVEARRMFEKIRGWNEELGTNERNTESVAKQPNYLLWTIVGVVALLLTGFLVFKQLNDNANLAPQAEKQYEQIAYANYTLPNDIKNRGKGIGDDSDKSFAAQGVEAVKQGDYQKAVSLFTRIDREANEETYEEIEEWLGHAYFNTKQYAAAAAVFENIVNNTKYTAKDRAEWYLTLSLLPNYATNRTQIDQILEKMTEPDNFHNYADRAIDLQEKLLTE